jgi:hypothetical protein
LTFCPTPGRPDYSEIWLDFKEFHRKLELKKYFKDNPTDEIPRIQRLFSPKSKWRPPVPNKTLETFYRAVKNDLIKINQQRSPLCPDNLSREDRLFPQRNKGFLCYNQKSRQRLSNSVNEHVRLPKRRIQTTK